MGIFYAKKVHKEKTQKAEILFCLREAQSLFWWAPVHYWEQPWAWDQEWNPSTTIGCDPKQKLISKSARENLTLFEELVCWLNKGKDNLGDVFLWFL